MSKRGQAVNAGLALATGARYPQPPARDSLMPTALRTELGVIPINQVTGAVIMMPVLFAAHRLEIRRLARAEH